MTSLQGLDDPTTIPGATPAFAQFVAGVRLYLRDYTALNRLIKGQETNDRMIAWCVVDAISEFNGMPPRLGTYNFDSLMELHLQSLLRMGTVVRILESVGLLQTRNHLPFNDGGLSVAVSDKAPLLQSWIDRLKGDWKMQVKETKIAMNIESLFDGGAGVSSEYFAISGWYSDIYI